MVGMYLPTTARTSPGTARDIQNWREQEMREKSSKSVKSSRGGVITSLPLSFPSRITLSHSGDEMCPN